MKIISLFSGAGGLDLWFHQAGFETIWANEYDKTIWSTFEHNFLNTPLDKRSITDIPSNDIPESIWIIWWPPCQSWSEAWACRWICDKRGQLFFEYIRVLKDKKPLFFLAENVSWILAPRHKEALDDILSQFENLWYEISYKLLNTNDYWVPQDRKRFIIIWYHKDMGKKFEFPEATNKGKNLKDSIWNLRNTVIAAKENNRSNYDKCKVFNHEYMNWGFSSMYMSRNRVRSWNEPSFTIQAGGRHAPIHPQAPKMEFISQNKRIFVHGKENLYRRLSVRECARIQTFPDNFLFKYDNIANGYKMVGNAVPVEFAKQLGNIIYKDISEYLVSKKLHLSTIKLNKKESIFLQKQNSEKIKSF